MVRMYQFLVRMYSVFKQIEAKILQFPVQFRMIRFGAKVNRTFKNTFLDSCPNISQFTASKGRQFPKTKRDLLQITQTKGIYY